jgi:hypothetical protein
LVELGYCIGETLRKSLQRIPQPSRAVTQPRTEEELQTDLARARTAGEFFRILPGHHLKNVDKINGMESERSQEETSIHSSKSK